MLHADLKRQICSSADDDWTVHEACVHEMLRKQLKDKRLFLTDQRSFNRYCVSDVICEYEYGSSTYMYCKCALFVGFNLILIPSKNLINANF